MNGLYPIVRRVRRPLIIENDDAPPAALLPPEAVPGLEERGADDERPPAERKAKGKKSRDGAEREKGYPRGRNSRAKFELFFSKPVDLALLGSSVRRAAKARQEFVAATLRDREH